MSLGYNLGPGGLMYSPERDVAYLYPKLVSCIKQAFNKDLWPELTKLLEQLGADWSALDTANVGFCEFLNIACEKPDETFANVCERAGWTKVSPAAQFGWLAMLGSVVMAQLFHSLRDVTLITEGRRPEVVDAIKVCKEARQLLNKADEGKDFKVDFKEMLDRAVEKLTSQEFVEILREMDLKHGLSFPV